MAINKSLFVLLAFIAALFFFLLAALSVTIGDVDLIPAGLTSLAAGFVIQAAP